MVLRGISRGGSGKEWTGLEEKEEKEEKMEEEKEVGMFHPSFPLQTVLSLLSDPSKWCLPAGPAIPAVR